MVFGGRIIVTASSNMNENTLKVKRRGLGRHGAKQEKYKQLKSLMITNSLKRRNKNNGTPTPAMKNRVSSVTQEPVLSLSKYSGLSVRSCAWGEPVLSFYRRKAAKTVFFMGEKRCRAF